MARAPALQAGGQGFDSLILHMIDKIPVFREAVEEFIDMIKGNEIKVRAVLGIFSDGYFRYGK